MAAAYSSLSHSVWAVGLSWIVVACSTGYGGYVNSILSAPILYPVSRITYCAYLVHPLVIRLTAMNLDSPFHLGNYTMVRQSQNAKAISYLPLSMIFITIYFSDDHVFRSIGSIVYIILHHIVILRSSHREHVKNTFPEKTEAHTVRK